MALKATVEPDSVRVRLVFNNVLQRDRVDRMLYLLIFSRTPTVAELLGDIEERFNVHGSLSCFIDGFLIPAWECTRILREDDVITLNSSSDAEESAGTVNEMKCNGSLKRLRVTDDREEVVPLKQKKSRSKMNIDNYAEDVTAADVDDACDDSGIRQKAKKHKKHKKKRNVSDDETVESAEHDNTELVESGLAMDSELVGDITKVDAVSNVECAVKIKRRRRKKAKRARSRKKNGELSYSLDSESADDLQVSDVCNNSMDTGHHVAKLVIATTATPAEVSVANANFVAKVIPSSKDNTSALQPKNTNVAKFRKNKNRRRRVIVPTLTYLQLASSRENAHAPDVQQSGQSEQSVAAVNCKQTELQNVTEAMKKPGSANSSTKRNFKIRLGNHVGVQNRSHIQFSSDSASEDEQQQEELNGDGEAETSVAKVDACIASDTSGHRDFLDDTARHNGTLVNSATAELTTPGQGHIVSGSVVQKEMCQPLSQPATATSNSLDALLDHRVHLVPASSRRKADASGQVTVFSRKRVIVKTSSESADKQHTGTSTSGEAQASNTTSLVPPRDYSSLPPLASLPAVGDTIAYKVLEMTASYTPEISSYKEARVTAVNVIRKMVTMELLPGCVAGKCEAGRFDVVQETDDEIFTNVDQSPVVTLHWQSLVEPRLICSS